MQENTKFKITYYSNKDKKHIQEMEHGQTSLNIGLQKLVQI